MDNLRKARNTEIVNIYRDLRSEGLSEFDTIDSIYNSEKNKAWCLSFWTIRMISKDPYYGQTSAQRKTSRGNGGRK